VEQAATREAEMAEAPSVPLVAPLVGVPTTIAGLATPGTTTTNGTPLLPTATGQKATTAKDDDAASDDFELVGDSMASTVNTTSVNTTTVNTNYDDGDEEGLYDDPPPKSAGERVRAELTAMGFTDAPLVDVVLAKHGADVEACARDLAAATEWESLLDDLAEMGFANRELNKTLLLKHNGNVKHTVRELVDDA